MQAPMQTEEIPENIQNHQVIYPERAVGTQGRLDVLERGKLKANWLEVHKIMSSKN